MKTSIRYIRENKSIREQASEASISREMIPVILETQILENDPFQNNSESLEKTGMLVSAPIEIPFFGE